MRKRGLLIALLTAGITGLVFCGSVFGYSSGTSYTWNSSTPNYNASATIHEGTIDTSTLTAGDFIGQYDDGELNSNAGFYGDSGETAAEGAATGHGTFHQWDDNWIGNVGDANTNGDALDGLWVQINSGVNGAGWWDLGQGFSQFAVMTSQDHGPYLDEGLEYRVVGSNGAPGSMALYALATITDIYLDGWRIHNGSEDANGNGWLSDDIAAVFQFKDNQAYRFIRLEAWARSPEEGGLYEPEIDNIAGVGAPVPEPSTILLLGLGLLGLAGYGRKRSRKG